MVRAAREAPLVLGGARVVLLGAHGLQFHCPAGPVGLHHRLILVIPVLSKTALFSLDVTKPNRFQQAVAVEGLLVNSEVVNKVVKEDVNEDVKEEVDEDVNEQRC